MSQGVTFFPPFLQNFQNFKNFFHDEKALEQVFAATPSPPITIGLLSGSKQVLAHALISPLLSRFATLSEKCGLRSLSRSLENMELTITQDYLHYDHYRSLSSSQFLCRSYSYPQDPYFPINLEAIAHSHLRPCFKKKPFSIKSFSRGSTEWFNFLLYKLIAHSQTKIDHLSVAQALSKVAQQFSGGIPPQGILLQALRPSRTKQVLECTYLSSSSKDYSLFSRIDQFLFGKKQDPSTEGQVLDRQVLEKDPIAAIQSFNKLKAGIYRISFKKHYISYIKSKEGSFVWDYKTGLSAIKNSAELIKCLNTVYFDRQVDGTINIQRLKPYSPPNCIKQLLKENQYFIKIFLIFSVCIATFSVACGTFYGALCLVK